VKILLVFDQNVDCDAFKRALLAYEGISVTQNSDPEEALEIVKTGQVEAVAVGESIGTMSGVEFIDALIKVNPMVNTVLASSLPGEEFHEETEGQGVLAQISVNPGKEDADLFIGKLRKIASLM